MKSMILSVLLACCVLPALAGDKPPGKNIKAIEALLEKGKAKELRDLGAPAIPALAALFKQKKYREIILPILAVSKTKLARTTIEEALAVENDDDWVFWQARALGLIKHAESRTVLLARIKQIKAGEPQGLGVLFGGGSDCAHFALIWALARLEGKDFGTSWLSKDDMGEYMLSGPLSANDLDACIVWWREHRKTLDNGKKK